MLFAEYALPNPSDVKVAATKIFEHRKTHEIPVSIGIPPATWSSSYSAMAKTLNLHEETIEGATARLNEYWRTVL